MGRVGRDLKDPSGSNPPAMSRDTFYQTRLLKAPSNLALNTSRAFLGNLFQCCTTLMVKNFFLIPNLNLPSKCGDTDFICFLHIPEIHAYLRAKP